MKKVVVTIILFLMACCVYGQQKNYEIEFRKNKQFVGGISIDGLGERKDFSGFLIEQGNQIYSVIDNRLYYSNKPHVFADTLKEPNYPLAGQGDNYSYILNSDPAVIRLSKLNLTGLSISGSNCSLRCKEVNFNRLNITHYNFEQPGNPLYLNGDATENMTVGSCRIGASMLIEKSKTGTLDLYDDTLLTNFGFYGLDLPKRINLNRLNFKEGGFVDLTTFTYTEGQTCILAVNQTDLSKVRLDYALFNLDRNGLDTPRMEAFYKQLLTNQEQSGYKDGYQKADIEFRKMENAKEHTYGKFLNWIQERWNNYGYNKEKIFINALWIYGIFFLLNLGWYRILNEDGYTIDTIQVACKNMKKKQWGYRVILYPFYGLFYTGILFWGLKLDFAKLKMKNGFMAIWILIQYIAGLVVLAYIANIVIGK